MAQTGDNSADISADDKPVAHPATPPHKRLLYTLFTGALQHLVIPTAYTYKRLFPTPSDPAVALTVKTYAVRPKLPVRIFFPAAHDRAAAPPPPQRRLPLLLSIHGGGFVLGDPADNDPFNAHFSATHGALVVALNYAKAPRNAFPGPRADLEALIAAVFADAELAPHIDPAKVAITGFSAGGNLALTVSQAPAVRERITAGAVPIYPVTDFSVASELKLRTRRYKAKLGGTRARPTDNLMLLAAVFNWAYIAAGHDLRDPLLSPLFAKRSDLPKRLWFVGCELDMLGHEAWQAACKFAGKRVPGLGEPIGQEAPIDGVGRPGALITTGNEAFAFDVKDEHGEVKWLCIPDAGHGFEMASSMGGDEAEVKDGQLKMQALSKEMGEWLFGQ